MPDPQKPDDLEFRKLSLEEKKFAFEVQKHSEEKPLKDLEREKTAAELGELKKPWWRKAPYLAPVATISVAIVGGILAFGTDLLKSNVPKLLQQRQQLVDTNAALQKKETELAGQIQNYKVQIQALQRERATLAAKLPFDQFQALLSALERETKLRSLEMNDPTFKAAYQAAIDAGPRSGVRGSSKLSLPTRPCRRLFALGCTLCCIGSVVIQSTSAFSRINHCIRYTISLRGATSGIGVTSNPTSPFWPTVTCSACRNGRIT
jgi:hypothetical protein